MLEAWAQFPVPISNVPWRKHSSDRARLNLQCAAIPFPTLALSSAGISGVRLVGDQGPCAGCVEVYLQGRWGTVCSLGWSTTSSSILCNTLGCGSPLETTAMLDHSVVLHGLLCGFADYNVSQCGSWLSDRKLHANANAVVVVCSGTGVTQGLFLIPPLISVVEEPPILPSPRQSGLGEGIG